MVRKKHPRQDKRSFVKRHKVFTTCFAVVVLGTVLILTLNTFIFTPVRNPQFGVTFTRERSEELGLSWKANYLALLDDMKLQHFRLTTYWSSHEPQRGKFDFTDLDWQIEEAGRRGATVDITLGLRQPRWPECWEPGWAQQLSGNTWKQALYAYIETVVNRYKHNPTVVHWQLENEAVNNWFGQCSAPDRQRLNEEYTLVRQLDPNRAIRMSLSDQHGLPFAQPVPDQYGFSVYRIVYNTFGPWHFYIVYPTPLWYHHLRAMVIDLIHHRPIFIHELQLEPWGPADTQQLSIEEQNKSMSNEQIGKSINFAKRIGASDIDLWGGEWWYWRKVHFGDSSVWEAVKEAVR